MAPRNLRVKRRYSVAQSWGQVAEQTTDNWSSDPSPSPSGQERRHRAWARLTASAARGDASAWRHLVTVHAGPLWGFALDCGLSPADAEQACELAWLRAAQSLEEVPQLGHAFGYALRATVVDEAHRARTPRGQQDRRPSLGLVSSTVTDQVPAGDAPTQVTSEPRSGPERRRQPRRTTDAPVSPYHQAFDRMATALEGIEQTMDERGPIVLPEAGALQENHPRP